MPIHAKALNLMQIEMVLDPSYVSLPAVDFITSYFDFPAVSLSLSLCFAGLRDQLCLVWHVYKIFGKIDPELV